MEGIVRLLAYLVVFVILVVILFRVIELLA